MASENNNHVRHHHHSDKYFLYDANLIEDAAEATLFDHSIDDCLADETKEPETAIGRGSVIFFEHSGMRLVYKHYQRGGLVAKFLHDRYFGLNPESSRAFRECGCYMICRIWACLCQSR